MFCPPFWWLYIIYIYSDNTWWWIKKSTYLLYAAYSESEKQWVCRIEKKTQCHVNLL